MGRRKKKALNRTRVYVVQDKSGSMASRVGATISGFNEYISSLKADAEGEVLVSVIQFDTIVEKPLVEVALADVKEFDEYDFIPHGMTALRDGVGTAISIAEKAASTDDKVLVVIMTDGGENSSREYTQEAIVAKIGQKSALGWEFVFLGAGAEAWDAGMSVFQGAIPHSHMLNYGMVDAHDHQAAYAAVSTLTSNTRRRSAGGQSLGFDADNVYGAKVALEEKAKAETPSR